MFVTIYVTESQMQRATAGKKFNGVTFRYDDAFIQLSVPVTSIAEVEFSQRSHIITVKGKP